MSALNKTLEGKKIIQKLTQTYLEGVTHCKDTYPKRSQQFLSSLTKQNHQESKSKENHIRSGSRYKQFSKKRLSQKNLTQSFYLPIDKRVKQRKREQSDSNIEKQDSRGHSSFNSNINYTCDVPSPRVRHLNKKSTLASTMCSKNEVGFLFSQIQKPKDLLTKLLQRSSLILQQYRRRCENLEKQNLMYRKKYEQAIKKCNKN